MTEQTADRAEIVVGVDGSDESFAALRWALHEAALTGQSVHAVFGWTPSWSEGDDQGDGAWTRMRHKVAAEVRDWFDRQGGNLDIDPDRIRLTSVKASGTSALLRIGRDAQQIVVGRRSLGRVMRWFMGSLSETLAEEAMVPVTVVRIVDDEDDTVQDEIADALTPDGVTVRHETPSWPAQAGSRRPVVVGVDGSDTSRRALDFAIDEARIHRLPLHVMFCWQLRDLGTVPGYEHAVPPVEVGQEHAERVLAGMVEGLSESSDVTLYTHAFHIPASKGLIAASRYAGHLVVGSRGLSGLDAHFLGSVSRQIVNFAECTVTVVH